MERLGSLERTLFGALGAVAPLVAILANTDATTIFATTLTGPVLAGWLARTGALLALGALVSYLNQDETQRLRAFMIGISAPAFVAAMVSQGKLAGQRDQFLALSKETSQALSVPDPHSHAEMPYPPHSNFQYLKRADVISSIRSREFPVLGVSDPGNLALGWRKLCVPSEDSGHGFVRGFFGDSSAPLQQWWVFVEIPLSEGEVVLETQRLSAIESESSFIQVVRQSNPDASFGPLAFTDAAGGRAILSIARKLDPQAAGFVANYLGSRLHLTAHALVLSDLARVLEMDPDGLQACR